MQPYFIPYAGYFRLLAATDVFVIYDCVQFSRRGWLHRNKMHNAAGGLEWMTLPLKKAPQDVLIKDLEFRDGARQEFLNEARRFPALNKIVADDDNEIASLLFDMSVPPADYIVRLLEWAAVRLDIPWTVLRSSTLDIDPAKRGEARILAIAAKVNATTYLNAPGGVDLYDQDNFRKDGIELRFLDNYTGYNHSILERLLTEDPASIRAEIYSQLG
ncbi:MAG: WbqC family protein [Beijerinckiaceae bacterium]|nr:WbqC family protein [Beijerinckiaceae bacterium]